jgi:hypothetical protein
MSRRQTHLSDEARETPYQTRDETLYTEGKL